MYLFKSKLSAEKTRAQAKNRRVHLSNERTFLAWIRTCIGIMAFGFVIEKFFLPPNGSQLTSGQPGAAGSHYYAFLGIFLVLLGAATGILAAYRFLKTEREIIEDTYRPSVAADLMVAILLGAIGVLLFIYLIRTL